MVTEAASSGFLTFRKPWPGVKPGKKRCFTLRTALPRQWRHVRLLKNPVQHASQRPDRSLAEDKVTHRPEDRSGGLLFEPPFCLSKGFFNSLICPIPDRGQAERKTKAESLSGC